MTITDYGLRFL